MVGLNFVVYESLKD
jgi:solute carrier family 25 (mitochondrial phosphate transporter), member 23/24/25/41